MLTTLLTTAPLQAATGSSRLALASDVAELVIAGAMLVLAIVAIAIFVRVNSVIRDLHRGALERLGPVSDRAKTISGNVEFITQALRTDVERLNTSVRALSDRLTLASERMEERIEEFNALMEVVQGEAEDVFLDTASTVRGVREGARAITDRASARPRPAAADDETDVPETADARVGHDD